MGDFSACVECEAIAQSLTQAYIDAWSSSDRNTRAAWKAVYRMIGGTEADVECVEELLPSANSAHLRVNEVLRKKFQHEAHTGHKVPRRFGDRGL